MLNRSCLQVRKTEKARQKYFLATVKIPNIKCLTTRVFLCVAETIVGSLLCCSVGIEPVRNTKRLPTNIKTRTLS